MKQVNWNQKVHEILMQNVSYVVEALTTRKGLANGRANEYRNAWRGVIKIEDNKKRNAAIDNFAELVVLDTEKTANDNNVFFTDRDKNFAKNYIVSKLSLISYGEERQNYIAADKSDFEFKIKCLISDAIDEEIKQGTSDFKALDADNIEVNVNGYGNIYKKGEKAQLPPQTQRKLRIISDIATRLTSDAFKQARQNNWVKNLDLDETLLMRELKSWSEGELRNLYLSSEEKRLVSYNKAVEADKKEAAEQAKREQELAKRAKEMRNADPLVKYADEIKYEARRLARIEHKSQRYIQTLAAAQEFLAKHKFAEPRSVDKKEVNGKSIMLLSDAKNRIWAQQDVRYYYIDLFVNEVEKARQEVLKEDERARQNKLQKIDERERANPIIVGLATERDQESSTLDNDIDDLTALVLRETAGKTSEEKKEIIKYAAQRAAELYGDKNAQKSFQNYLIKEINEVEKDHRRKLQLMAEREAADKKQKKEFEEYVRDGYRVSKLDENTDYATPIPNDGMIPYNYANGNPANGVLNNEVEEEQEPVLKQEPGETPVTTANPKTVVKKHHKTWLVSGLLAVAALAGIVGYTGLSTQPGYRNKIKDLADDNAEFVKVEAKLADGSNELDSFKIYGIKDINKDLSKMTDMGYLREKVGLRSAQSIYSDAYIQELASEIGKKAGGVALVSDLKIKKNTTQPTSITKDEVKVAYPSQDGKNVYEFNGMEKYLKECGKLSDTQTQAFKSIYDYEFCRTYVNGYEVNNYTDKNSSSAKGEEDLDYGKVFGASSQMKDDTLVAAAIIDGHAYFLGVDKLYDYDLGKDVSSSMSTAQLSAKIASAGEPVKSNVCSNEFMTTWTNRDSNGHAVVSERKMEQFKKNAAQRVGVDTENANEKVVIAERHTNVKESKYNGTVETLTYVGLDSDGEIVGVDKSKEPMKFFAEAGKDVDHNATAAAAFAIDNGASFGTFTWDGIEYGYDCYPSPAVSLKGKEKQ